MEAGLHRYATLAMQRGTPSRDHDGSIDLCMEEHMHAFDNQSALETLTFFQHSLSELRGVISDASLLEYSRDNESDGEADKDDNRVVAGRYVLRERRSNSEGVALTEASPLVVH
jgi:hypothetical protein